MLAASRSGGWKVSPPPNSKLVADSALAESTASEPNSKPVTASSLDSAPAATSAASLPAKSGSIIACASRISWRKDSIAISARVGMRWLAMAALRASQVETPVSRASRSRVSSEVLPMPRAGVLMTRCKAIESWGLRMSLR